MCAHEGWRVNAEVKAASFPDQSLPMYDVKVSAVCRKCGTPLRFAPSGGVMVESKGLVAVMPATPAGD